ISDGLVVSDRAGDLSGRLSANAAALQAVDLRKRLNEGSGYRGAWKGELLDALQAAWRVLSINRFRTALTVLGMVIGVAS
ncbi:macrolide ABC transporter permease/ATP-binding protein MacB, partial [Pseudomonas syringae pv. tagetis]